MRGNALRYPDKTPSLAANRTALLNWLCGAKAELVAAMDVETLARRHKLHANARENERQVEALLLAAQDRIRREAVTRPI